MKNEFIPTNFEIVPLEKDAPQYPTLIKVSTCFLLSNNTVFFWERFYYFLKCIWKVKIICQNSAFQLYCNATSNRL